RDPPPVVPGERLPVGLEGRVRDYVPTEHGPVSRERDRARDPIDLDPRLRQPARGRTRDVVHRPDVAVEELVLADGEPVGPAGPDERRFGAARKGAVDPVRLDGPYPLEERAARKVLESVRSPPDRLHRENPECEHEKWERDGIPAGDEEERRGEGEGERERGGPHPARAHVILQ